MNGTQVVIAASFGGLVLVSLVVAFRVIRSTGVRQRRRGVDTALLARRENKLAAAVTIALLVLLAATMAATPYGETSEKGAQRVKVTAFQFGWKIEPDSVKANRPVAFEINSRDVQHGFGIYKAAKLIAQVQVPALRPGSDQEVGAQQRLIHTFHEPGRYDVLCLEYCGLNHDKMRGGFTVKG